MDLSPAALVVALLVSSTGLGLFLYGKKQKRPPQLGTGLALMVLPMVAPSALLDGSIALALIAALWLAVRRGW